MAFQLSKKIIKAIGFATVSVSLFTSRLSVAEVDFLYGEQEPKEFIELLTKKIKLIEKEIWGDVVVAIGHDGFVKALKTKRNNVVAAFISRGDFESIATQYKRRDISVLYFDPSPENMHKLAVTILANSIGASHNIGVLSSQKSEKWFSKLVGVDMRIRMENDAPNMLLKGDVTDYLFVVPADNELMKGISLSDLITTLIEKRTGLIGFSPYLKNSAGNVYYDPSEYATELGFALKYSDGSFKKYPSNPRFKINKKILSAIGIRYKGSMSGALHEK